MLLLIGRSLFKNLGDLNEAVFPGLGSIICIFVARLGFTRECFLQILFGFGAFQFAYISHHKYLHK